MANFDDFIAQNENLEKVIPRGLWDYVEASGRMTAEHMGDKWVGNVEQNLLHLYKRHGSLSDNFLGFGQGKAVIMVGAGPSFNINKHHLKQIYEYNTQFELKDQPFIIIASNHQFKPLLKMGIFPHFVLLGDGGSHIYDQLNTKIPKLGKNSILIATLYADHKTVREWSNQGRPICFFLPQNEKYIEMFEKSTGDDPTNHMIGQGGNVVNAAFMLSLKMLRSRVFMVVGNDLSFPHNPNANKRREFFYADGDYTSNISRGVDEAKDKFMWLGIKMRDNPFEPGKKIVELEPVGVSRQLFIYKTWAETHAISWADSDVAFHYYNCSEGGISGVMAHSYNSLEMHKRENWYLLDDIIPKRWRTRSLLQAVSEFLEARILCQTNQSGLISGADANLLSLPGKTDIVKTVDRSLIT